MSLPRMLYSHTGRTLALASALASAQAIQLVAEGGEATAAAAAVAEVAAMAAEAAEAAVREVVPGARVLGVELDLAELASVRGLPARLNAIGIKAIDVLVLFMSLLSISHTLSNGKLALLFACLAQSRSAWSPSGGRSGAAARTATRKPGCCPTCSASAPRSTPCSSTAPGPTSACWPRRSSRARFLFPDLTRPCLAIFRIGLGQPTMRIRLTC